MLTVDPGSSAFLVIAIFLLVLVVVVVLSVVTYRYRAQLPPEEPVPDEWEGPR